MSDMRMKRDCVGEKMKKWENYGEGVKVED